MDEKLRALKGKYTEELRRSLHIQGERIPKLRRAVGDGRTIDQKSAEASFFSRSGLVLTLTQSASFLLPSNCRGWGGVSHDPDEKSHYT